MSEYTGTGMWGLILYVLYMYACTYNISVLNCKRYIPVNSYQCIHVLQVLCFYEMQSLSRHIFKSHP